ncbi:Glycerol-3-phosphate acyltransferase [bioreactor metagenome]|jgi:glycerol-3-phosphate acyltransferase PlsY|uniref:Glycerol-3-phosphate acyltransferase n=2 Tax=root TaxID=1 RepID=A0A562J9V7_9FIRM|nr:glycerol-3-phosphate 1-O-acyltransferase PlsY [Sedimentibacter saalensis]MEA5095844.1 glycerol-3-phosphate 1-O-acyltransferase PlsY [Sedimentibacter saalensis]TWH79900.1 glycerol-3-phosphate acyltransferase PlsY [Sedimentibacter saalensis]
MNYFFIAIISYLLGNISFAYILGKIFTKKDVRDYGSGNAGATNAIRAFGKKIGAMVFIGDVLKGVIAVLIGKTLGVTGMYLAGAMVIIGHNWPVFLNFKGGKGVATTIGVMIIASPFVTMICFVLGLVVIIATRTVSLGSIIGMAMAPLAAGIFVRPFDMSLFIFCLFIGTMAIYRHKENIKRILNGKENKL